MFIRQCFSKVIKSRIFFSFSRYRRKTPQNQMPTEDDFEIPDFDFQNFDYLASLQMIQVFSPIQRQELISKIRKQSYQGDQQCLKILRKKYEQLIIKISQGEDTYNQLQEIITLKMAVSMTFRRWDQIAVDIDNYIQTLKYQKDQIDQAEEKTIPLYNQLLATFIMSDHNRLYQFLRRKDKVVKNHRRKIKSKENSDVPFGLEKYHIVDEKLKFIDRFNDQAHQYCQIALLKAIAMFSVGKRTQAIELLCILTSNRFANSIRQKAYISILTSLLLPDRTSQKISQNMAKNIALGYPLTESEAEILANCHIETNKCQEIVSSLLMKFRGVKIEQVQSEHLNQYGLLLMLICENYYLKNNTAFKTILSLLQSQKNHLLSIPLKYFKLGMYIDQNDHDQISLLLKEFKAEEEEITEEGKGFYQASQINFDLWRVNIRKMASIYYKSCEINQKAREYGEQAEILECVLGIYSIKEPDNTEEDEEDKEAKLEDWREKVSKRIPYYYFNLNIQDIFPMET